MHISHFGSSPRVLLQPPRTLPDMCSGEHGERTWAAALPQAVETLAVAAETMPE